MQIKMKTSARLLAVCLTLSALASLSAWAVDTDIFTATSTATAPNVLIILDNTSNWSRNDEKFPDGNGGTITQGQAEVDAIKSVIQNLGGFVNVGLMEFVSGGPATDNGGYIRYAVSPMGAGQTTGATNKTNFSAILTTIYNSITSPNEKTNSGMSYGNLMYDAYNYWSGNKPYATSGDVVGSLADSNGYTTNYTQFKAPISAANTCDHNYIIFIGNPPSRGPSSDDSTNTAALAAVGGSTSQLSLQQYSTTTQNVATNLGYSSACFASQPSGTPADYAAQCPSTGTTWDSCGYSTSDTTTSLPTCAAGTSRYSVVATGSSSTIYGTPVVTHNLTTGPSSCMAAPTPGTTSDHGGLSCPANTTSTSGNQTTTVTHSCSYSVASTVTGTACSAAVTTTGPTNQTAVATTSYSNSCYASAGAWSNSDKGTLTCPATTTSTSGNTTTTTTHACGYSASTPSRTGSCAATVTTTGPTTTNNKPIATADSVSCYASASAAATGVAGGDHGGLSTLSNSTVVSGPTTTTTTYSNWIYTAGSSKSTHCTGSNYHYPVTQTANTTVSTSTSTPNYNFTVTQTDTPSVSTSTSTPNAQYVVTQDDMVTTTVNTTVPPTTTTLGNTFACYSSLSSCSPADYTCPSGSTCACSSTGATTGGICPAGARYQALGYTSTIVSSPTSPAVYATDTAPYNADEWARFLYQTGVPVAGTTTKATASTYTIDVYGIKPSGTQSSLLSSMAKAGGGRYFSATNEAAIITALKNIFSEIQATNSTFASAALPISSTQRAQNDNQVYIGVFRPDPQAFPRWFGNMKRYQLGVVNGGIDLVDMNNVQAVSTVSGFLAPCAQSFWTVDSANYWATVSGSTVSPRIFTTTASTAGTAWTTQGDDTALAKGGCTTLGSAYSDLPDGPTVEKGGAAEIMRSATSRTVKTLSGTSLVDFSTANVTSLSSNSVINANIVNFILGQDVTGEIGGTASTSNRPSIHGAVVHSRPLPVDFGGSVGVKVFYGSNDGAYRSVNAATGAEDWAFVPPESNSYLQRLMDNTPLVQTPSPTPPGQTAAAGTPKDFFFDGSTGLYQNSDNSKVWIYPTMRRGGRMLYAFDVSTPATASTYPTFKWKAGCPNLGNDTGCTTDKNNVSMSAIGQTWSTPNLVFLNGYSKTTPVVVVGGGYDTCEDADTASPSCTSPKGAGVYVLDANDGTVVAFFATDRSVAGDVALVDINQDGTVDAAYVADTGGNLYRINFSDPSSFAPFLTGQWAITKVAYTSGASRKFLFAPAVLPYKNQVYVAIGSGDREHPTGLSYPYTTPVVNRAYVYLDDPTKSTLTNLDTMLNRSNAATVTCTSSSVLPGGVDKGWYMDLTAYGTGEQTVTSAIITAGMVAFSTNRPIVNAASCSSALGEARGYWLNLLNGAGAIGVTGTCGGTRSSTFVGGGLPPSPVTGIVTVNGAAQNVVIGAAKRDGSASTAIGGQLLNPSISTKRSRIYWRTAGDTY